MLEVSSDSLFLRHLLILLLRMLLPFVEASVIPSIVPGHEELLEAFVLHWMQRLAMNSENRIRSFTYSIPKVLAEAAQAQLHLVRVLGPAVVLHLLAQASPAPTCLLLWRSSRSYAIL